MIRHVHVHLELQVLHCYYKLQEAYHGLAFIHGISHNIIHHQHHFQGTTYTLRFTLTMPRFAHHVISGSYRSHIGMGRAMSIQQSA